MNRNYYLFVLFSIFYCVYVIFCCNGYMYAGGNVEKPLALAVTVKVLDFLETTVQWTTVALAVLLLDM